ncbi:MAG: hypothetical protein N2257_01005 [Thermodesulfovibrionales bacterium]|nr:hypothetical protein [Thermodesulfovibrionales bacterium]
MKLGEALVKEGLITPAQLNMALERQVIFGGRIGTNLVELGVIKEDELLQFLSKYFRLPAVPLKELNSVPEDVTACLNKETIEKYRIIPFRKDKNRLHVAMLNPKDMRAIDELRFTTGFDIIPYVITELRLLFAMEKYYGIKRDLRYISIPERERPEQDEIKEESINKIKEALAGVKDRDEIGAILLNEARRIAERAALFLIKDGKITGWKAKGLNIEGFELPEEETSIFSEVLRTKNYYRGPVLKIKGNEGIIKFLGGAPQDALLIPVNIRDRIVLMLYIDNGNESVLNANISHLLRISSMAALSFEILILKKRIMEL